MNEVEATVSVYDKWIAYEYKYDDKTYTIEVPKTKENSHLVDDQKIIVYIGIRI